jgi:hypothetical protein
MGEMCEPVDDALERLALGVLLRRKTLIGLDALDEARYRSRIVEEKLEEVVHVAVGFLYLGAAIRFTEDRENTGVTTKANPSSLSTTREIVGGRRATAAVTRSSRTCSKQDHGRAASRRLRPIAGFRSRPTGPHQPDKHEH